MKSNKKKVTLLKGLKATVYLSAAWSASIAFAAENDDQLPEFSLEDTVVTAEKIPTKRQDTPSNIVVVTAKEITENHHTNIAEVLNHINGVIVTTQGSGEEDLIRINGDDRVVVLIDGQRLNNDQGVGLGRASVDLKMIPSLKNIERIEIIKGGGSAIYGSDAIGGVINIITKKGDKLLTTIDLNTGSWGIHNYEITNQGSNGRFSWYITGGLQKRRYFKFKDSGETHRMPSSDYSNNSLSLRLDNKFDERSSLNFNFMHRSIDSNQYYYSNYGTPGFYASSPQEEIFNNVSLSYKFKEGTATPGILRYFNNYKSADFSGKFNTRIQGVDYQNGWELDKQNKLIAGIEWHQSDSTNETGGYRDRKLTNQAIYLQDTITLTNKWTLVPGIRLDHHSEFGTHWSPKAAINYKADDKTKLYASWGRVYKAPSADDLYYFADYGSWGGYYGNSHLRPETGHTEMIGITHAFSKKVSMDINFFNSQLHDAINWYSTDYMNYYNTNIAKEKKRGLEISFRQRINDNWSYDLGYSHLHSESSDASNAAAIQYINNNSQPNGFHLGIHYQHGALKANLLGTMGSGLNKTYYENSKYAKFDFNVSYDVSQQATLYFKANNLTNQAYSGFAGRHYPAQGRFFQVGVNYSF